MNELTQELCRKLRKYFHTGVREENVATKVGGTVLPTIPQAFKGIDVRFETSEKETVTEIEIYPVRTADAGVMNFDLKGLAELFEPLLTAYGRCIDSEKATLDLTGYYCDTLFRIQLFLKEEQINV